MSATQERILAVVTEEPQTTKRIARLANLSYSSRFRQVIADMLRAGVIVRVADGIALSMKS